MEAGRPARPSRAGRPASMSTALELRAADIGERGFLPDRRRKVPAADAGFAIISACSVRDGSRTPIVEAQLQQGSGRNLHSRGGSAAFEPPRGQRRARRRAPEMPDLIAALSHAESYSVIVRVVSQRNGIMGVVREPGLALVEATPHLADVVIEDNFLAIDAAGESGPCYFYLRRFMFRHAGVSDRDAPHPGGSETRGWAMRIHVSGFVAHLIRDARIVNDDECRRAPGAPLLCDHNDSGGGDLVRHDDDEIGRGNRMKDCIRCVEKYRGNVLQIFTPDLDPRAFGAAVGSHGNDFGGCGLRGQAWQCEQGEGSGHNPDQYPSKVIVAV